MSDTRAVAEDFTNLLKADDHMGAAMKYWSDDVVSLEGAEGDMARVEGKDAVIKKGEWWYENHDVHSVTAEGPYVNGDQFIVKFEMDITEKASGNRMQMAEMGVYTVKNGKVVEERFYY